MKDIEAEIIKYLSERGWDKLRPADISKSICIEAAELLEIFQWSNDGLERVKQNSAMMQEIKKELADVFIYSLDMSVLLSLDTKQIILEKLEQVKRKYPAALMKNEPEHGSNFFYLKIKNDYRKKFRKT